MNITLVMVSTADGKTTHPTTHGWSSAEDRKFFTDLKTTHRLLFMGRSTYETVRSTLRPSPTLRRIVLTSHPERFSKDTVEGQLEFSAEDPAALVKRLERQGYTEALLVGGATLNATFLREKLITDCFLTVEPRFFGSGNGIYTSDPIDVRLSLTDVQRINKQGTLILHYLVSYDHSSRQDTQNHG